MGDEGFEKLWQNFRRDAAAGIAEAQDNIFADAIDAEGDDAAAAHRFARVLDQVTKDAGKAREIDLEIAVVAEVFNELDVLAGQELERLLVQLIEQTPDGDAFFL